MSWPHILSFSRIVVGPAIAALILVRPGTTYLIAAVVFALASLTDLLDGKLARHAQRVSPLGIFIDTTADKVLVSLVLVAMTVAGLTGAWIPLIIIGREMLISGLRSFAASCNRIISAHIWGKGKAALTMIAIPLVLTAACGKTGGLGHTLLPAATWRQFYLGASGLLALSAIATVASGARYVVDAWPLFRPAPPRPIVDLEERRRAAGGTGSRLDG